MTSSSASAPRAPSGPFLSVVISAWDRREFLRPAVESVLASDPPGADFEVIVIKNFADPDLDAELDRCRVRREIGRDASVGASVARALEAATGEVVCFLDDDDEFEPAKLARIAALFRADPTLVLVRNGYRPIDAEGRSLAHWPICDWPAVAPARAITLRTAREKRQSRVLPMYNLSTLSVRRAALLPFASTMREIAAGTDSLVFLAALSTGGGVRVDPDPLTRHRIHGSASMEIFRDVGVAPPSSPDYLRRSLAALEGQARMVEGTPAEAWARWLVLITRFDAYLSRPEFAPPSGRDYFEFARGAIRERQRFRAPPLGFAAARRLFPRSAYAAWWAFRRHQHRVDAGRVEMPEVFARRDERA
ncbi:MAG: glycosyltransferase family 2 protein [Thermoplasmata archaeon]